MNGIWVLARRELRLYIRQPSRLFGSLVQPLMFWFFMGAGFADSFSGGSGGVSYGEFFFPGIVLMLLLFAAIFSTITLIEDRKAGFLQGVLVAPLSRLSLVLGKLLGGTAIAVIQALLFVLLAPLAGFALSAGEIAGLLPLFVLVGMGFTGLGFVVAWLVENTAGYHAIMSVVMIPLWLLSGALFPLEGASSWLGWIMRFNPVTYAMLIVRSAFYAPLSVLAADGEFVRALVISALWTLLTLGASVWIVCRRTNI